LKIRRKSRGPRDAIFVRSCKLVVVAPVRIVARVDPPAIPFAFGSLHFTLKWP
jgi:hypothetical protein